MSSRLLIIDDDPRSVDQLQREVKPLHWSVATVFDQEAAYRMLKGQRFDFALVDIRLKSDPGDLSPDPEVGYATIRHLREHYTWMKIIAVTAFDDKSEVNTNAVKAGADDFWSKRLDASEKLLAKIRRLMGGDDPSSSTANFNSKEVPSAGAVVEKPLAYESMESLRIRIRKFAKKDVTILLAGETGTGKGYFAEEIHRLSHRKDKPFQVLNCPQQNTATIVSELFGHERGSFTGANQKRQGLAASATGGTLFLDEIEALDLDCQAAILRFIDQKEIKPLGSNKTEVVDIRLIVATNRDLGEMVAEGKFRDDLHSRLAGVVFEIPPLRERGTDEIAKLAKFFYRSFKTSNAKKKGFTDVRVPDSLWKALAEYPHHWPGNVRELKQVIESALFEGGGKVTSLEYFVRHMRNDGKVTPNPAQSSDSGMVGTVSMTSREERIVQFIRDRGKASRSEVETAFDLGGTAVWTVLKGLVNKGVLQREGNGRGVVYVYQFEQEVDN